MSGPAINPQGTRFHTKDEWMFGKGFFGPPDGRILNGITREQARAWGVITHRQYEMGW
jgi:hypothetical protein